MHKSFSEWEQIKNTLVNERTFRRHREKLKLGKVVPSKKGGIGYVMTEDEFDEVVRSVRK